MTRLVLALVLSMLSVAGFAEQFTAGAITIEQPWARPTPPGAETGAGYFTLVNAGGENDRLLSAAADVSEIVELHTHIMENDVMRMRPVDAVEIPAGESVSFAPGGLHVMFIGITAPMVEGDEFPLTLVFEHAGEITVTMKVRNPEAMMGSSHSGMKQDHSQHGQ